MGRILRRRQSSLEDSENRVIGASKTTSKFKKGLPASDNFEKKIVNNLGRMAFRDKTNALKEVQVTELSPEKSVSTCKTQKPREAAETTKADHDDVNHVRGENQDKGRDDEAPGRRVRRRGAVKDKKLGHVEQEPNQLHPAEEDNAIAKPEKNAKLAIQVKGNKSSTDEIGVTAVKKSKRIATSKILSEKNDVKSGVAHKVPEVASPKTTCNSPLKEHKNSEQSTKESKSPISETEVTAMKKPKRIAARKGLPDKTEAVKSTAAQKVSKGASPELACSDWTNENEDTEKSVPESAAPVQMPMSKTSGDPQGDARVQDPVSEANPGGKNNVRKGLESSNKKPKRNLKRRCQAKENESPVSDQSPSGAKKSKRVVPRKALVDKSNAESQTTAHKATVIDVPEKRPSPLPTEQTELKDKESEKSPVKTMTISESVPSVLETPLSRKSGDAKAVVDGKFSSKELPKFLPSVEPEPCCSRTLPPVEPKPGCSREGVCFKKPKAPGGPKRSPASAKMQNPSLFSIFKKPDTPRRLSGENKIFVSGLKPNSSPDQETGKHQRPVYDNPSMTPLRRRTSLSLEKKEEQYEFEVDENEPRPKKKQRRIMKIQRVRAAPKKRQLKPYVADPEAELRVLRNFDLSPSVLNDLKSDKRKKIVTAEPRVLPAATENADAVTPGVVETNVNTPGVVSSERVVEDAFTPNLDDFDPGPMSSPCGPYGSSTPMYGHESSLELTRVGLSNKCYSPVKAKDSPMPVLLGEYYSDPKRSREDCDARSNVTSGHSYGDDLDVSASTPIKRRRHDSTTIVQELPKPVDLNLSNCFGFDEPEVMEKPLMSPIKGATYVPSPVASPRRAAPILRKKLPLQCGFPQPAVDVGEVIKQLRFEVGSDSSADASADLSVYDDSDITSLKGRSPMKRFLQQEKDKKAHETAAETAHGSRAGDIPVPAKVPRLSYERPTKLRKQKVVDDFYKDDSMSEDPPHVEFYFEHEQDEGEPEVQQKHKNAKKTKPSPVKKDGPKKKERGMTKKEEEEMEKWAKMFNSQCDQVESYGLCVE